MKNKRFFSCVVHSVYRSFIGSLNSGATRRKFRVTGQGGPTFCRGNITVIYRVIRDLSGNRRKRSKNTKRRQTRMLGGYYG